MPGKNANFLFFHHPALQCLTNYQHKLNMPGVIPPKALQLKAINFIANTSSLYVFYNGLIIKSSSFK